MKTKLNPTPVDHFRLHLGGNALCFAVCLGFGIVYTYFAFTLGGSVSQTLSLVALSVGIIAFVFTLIGLLSPDRFTYGGGGKGKRRYADFTAKEKREYVSSTYALWSLLALVEVAMIFILVFKD